MNKAEFLEQTKSQVNNLITDPIFRNNIAQIRTRSLQEELQQSGERIRFTFDPEQVWKYCDFIFSECVLLLNEEVEGREAILGALKLTAQTFEFLARFEKSDNQEMMLLNAVICYHISGYQANAYCLVQQIKDSYPLRNIEQLTELQPDESLTQFFKLTLLHYLSRNVQELQIVSQKAKSYTHETQSTITEKVSIGDSSIADLFTLTAHGYFQEFALKFCDYCLNGLQESLDLCKSHLQTSLDLFKKAGDSLFSTITMEILATLKFFAERSTWSHVNNNAGEHLDNEVWQLYLRNLAYEKSIVEFWLSQIRAINAGLLRLEDSFVVQMPTSAGKTFVAELAILAALSQSTEAKCLYIAPFRALVNEVEASLSENLGPLGFNVSNLMGGFEFNVFEEYLAINSRVIVATPEKVELLIRTHPEFFESLQVVVIDEGHIIDEGIPASTDNSDINETLIKNSSLGRGPLLELLITRLKNKLPECRFVFMSAVMPDINTDDFTKWLSKNTAKSIRVSKEERPSRQAISMFQWDSTKKNGQLEFRNLPKLPGGRNPFVPHFLERSSYDTGEETPTGKRQTKSWPDLTKAATTAMLALKLVVAGPVLVFCAMKKEVIGVTEKLITSLKYLEASDKLPLKVLSRTDTPACTSYLVAKEWLGEDNLLVRALCYGVALHYGPLPDPVRRAIENDFQLGLIHILVSTNTLGQGVNLPIKTAIIHSLVRRWPDQNDKMQDEKIKRRDFWNICGRAGRAGKETEGQVVFVSITSTDRQLIDEYTNDSEPEEVQSALYKLLQALIEKRIDQDGLIGYLDSHVLAILNEEIVDTDDEKLLIEWLGTSLVGVQAIRHGTEVTSLAAAITKTANWIRNEVSPELLEVFSATGLSVRSCQALLKEVTEFCIPIDLDTYNQNANLLLVDNSLLSAAFNACKSLPEMQFSDDSFGIANEEIFLQEWVDGNIIDNLRKTFSTADNDDLFVQFLSERLTYKLPWGFNGFIHILAYQLELPYEKLPLNWQHLPAMAKFGVNNVLACWTINITNVSRGFSLDIAGSYPQDNIPEFSEFLSWLTNYPTNDIVYKFDAMDYEKRKLIQEISNIVIKDEQLNLIRKGARVEVPLVGIDYIDIDYISEISVGDKVEVEIDEDNLYDNFAVKAIWNDRQIGYLRRNVARIVCQELQFRNLSNATINNIVRNKEPQKTYLEISIQFER